MLRYLKNMSTFRFILLLLALASGCFLLLGLFRARPSNAEKRQSRRMWQALQDAENEFAEHLTLQESLGAALAVQYESPGEPMSAERFKPVMESLLATSPEFIESMGLRLGSRDDAGTHVIYRIARTSGEAAANIYPDRPLQQELELSRHIVRRNAREREVGWRLLAEPHSDAGKRFSIIFFAVLNEPRQGLAVVKANFDWLKNVLSSLVDAGIAVPLCVSPDRDVLWLDGDGLLWVGTRRLNGHH